MKIQGGLIDSGQIAHVSHSKAIGLGNVNLVWVENASQSLNSNTIVVPVYINEDRSELLFTVKMEAKDDIDELIRKGIAIFI